MLRQCLVLSCHEKFTIVCLGIIVKECIVSPHMQLYQRADIFDSVHKACGVKPQDLNNVMVWADAVRESRNSVHYGAEPPMPNMYEKIAALLIDARPILRNC